MSEFEYTDPDGDTVTFSRATNGGVVVVASDAATSGVARIEPADVPTVAAELLKAAGQDVTMLPKATMPVTEWSNSQIRCGDVIVHAHSTPEHLRSMAASYANDAANHIAIAEYIESKAAREADAEKKLQERRDALAGKFSMDSTGCSFPYDALDFAARNAIDYIIEDGK